MCLFICIVVLVVLIKATILEEMPPFPERESSILAKLKKKRPDKVANNTIEPRASNAAGAADNGAVQSPKPSALVRFPFALFVASNRCFFFSSSDEYDSAQC